MVASRHELLVLGSGVSGLSCGILLLKAGYKVTIWAKDFPPNTTSDRAAAFWYPYLVSPRDKATVWASKTLRYLRQIAQDDPDSGCVARIVTEVFDHQVDSPWWARPVHGDLPEGYVDGYQTRSILMDTTKYMEWLMNEFAKLGGERQQHEVSDIRETFEAYDIVVNCTGLGSRQLMHDDRVYPIRGQVVKVKPNGFERIIADDEGPNRLAVIIPRLRDTILGGTAQANDWNLETSEQDTKDILRKAAKLSPLFEQVEVIDAIVGLRPARDKVRMELEAFGPKWVVHNYGHGGSGFTLSWGCAQDVVEVVNKL